MAGCRSTSATGPTPEPPTLEASTPQAQPTAVAASSTPQARSSEVVISYSRSGGIAGVSEQWTISSDGRVFSPAGQAAQIPPDELEELLAEIEAAGFFEWPARPGLPGTCADCFTYTLAVNYQGQANQVVLVDGQAGAPDEAWTILERIAEVLESVPG